MLFGFRDAVETVGKTVDAAGVLVVVLGLITATWRYARSRSLPQAGRLRSYRQEIGKAILLGLEFLVAGDIIRSVAVDPTLSKVLVLAVIVLIRTFLSMTLEVELEGRWPWQAGRPTPDPRG